MHMLLDKYIINHTLIQSILFGHAWILMPV